LLGSAPWIVRVRWTTTCSAYVPGSTATTPHVGSSTADWIEPYPPRPTRQVVAACAGAPPPTRAHPLTSNGAASNHARCRIAFPSPDSAPPAQAAPNLRARPENDHGPVEPFHVHPKGPRSSSFELSAAGQRRLKTAQSSRVIACLGQPRTA